MSDLNLRPLGDRLIVERIEKEQKTMGGIVIPDTAKEKPAEGKVVAVGPGKHMDNGNLRVLDVKKGDKILFGKYSGNEIEINGAKYLVLREEDVLAIMH